MVVMYYMLSWLPHLLQEIMSNLFYLLCMASAAKAFDIKESIIELAELKECLPRNYSCS